jgi:hypothetical protein
VRRSLHSDAAEVGLERGIMTAIYAHVLNEEKTSERKFVDVFVCKDRGEAQASRDRNRDAVGRMVFDIENCKVTIQALMQN